MKRQSILLVGSLAFGTLGISMASSRADEPTTQPAAISSSIEVCFVLDTTGSMGGLIEGAKQKIWSIANSIAAAKKGGGSVRFALVGYRDRGDDYITRITDLTDDLDKIFADLQTFQAGGGGDTPESVNQALAEAVGKVKWSGANDVRKLIFLVGDAPPHIDYPNDTPYAATCENAVKAGVIINTVQCGTITGTREIWEEIAHRGEGAFVALEQSGNMVTIVTPMDEQIAKLSEKIAGTSLAYGPARQQAEVMAKNVAAATAPASVAADRAAYNYNTGGRAVQGRGDLVSDLRDKSVKLDSIAKDELPKELQDLSPEEREKKIAELGSEREVLTKQVADLSRQRQAFIDEELKKQPDRASAFDTKVAEIVRTELNRTK